MEEKVLDFTIQEAGCLLYAADSRLGGFPFGELTEFFGGREGLRDLTLSGAVMMTSLYQDDGYSVRVRFGPPTAEEEAEWTAKADWKLNLESGRMVVSGVCDEDLEDYLEDFPVAETGGEYDLGFFVEVPPGEYRVTIYSFPPGDLAGGWMRIENPRLFKECLGREPGQSFETPLDYFNRTRPAEMPPVWVTQGFEDADFLNFLISLTPLSDQIEPPEFEPDGCVLWTYRKPDRFPTGIRL